MDKGVVGVDIRLRAVMAEFEIKSNPAMAETCGTSTSAVSNWLAPPRADWKNRPKVPEMITLCEKTGLTLDWIYRGISASMDPKLVLRLSTRIANGNIKEFVVRRPRRT
jgi:hypothetical protein